MNKFLILFRNPRRFFSAFKRKILGKTGCDFKACITRAEIACLQKYAKSAKLGIVEIGVLDCGTTREMALVAKAPIFGIDPLIPDSMNANLQGQEKNIKKNLGFYKKFIFIKNYSYNAVKNWNKPFDFIFIDGDHNYEAVKKDVADWLPLLSANGFMALHDSANQGYDGPKKVAYELMSDPRVEYAETMDSITVFRKI